MAAAYYKHLDRHTPPLLEQRLLQFWSENNMVNDLLFMNERSDTLHSQLDLVEKDLVAVDYASFRYLVRRSRVPIMVLCNDWDSSTLARLLPELRNLSIERFVVDEHCSSECISLIEEMIWQNQRLIALELNPVDEVEFFKLESVAQFYPFNQLNCFLDTLPKGKDIPWIENRQLIGREGHWNDWIDAHPSLTRVTNLDCHTPNIVGISHTLTQNSPCTIRKNTAM